MALVCQFHYGCCVCLLFFFITLIVDVLALAGGRPDDSVRLVWMESQSPRVAIACGSSVSFGLKRAKGGGTWA